MGVRSTEKFFIYISLSNILVIAWQVATSDACPEKCICTAFGSKRLIVKCKGINQVPHGLPVNTVKL